MTGIETALVGSALASSTAGASAVGLLGAGGVFAPMAGSMAGLFSGLGTLGTIASLGSSFLGSQASSAESAAEQTSAKYNAAVERINTAESIRAKTRDQYLRAGAQKAAGGAQGRGGGGNVLDIMADTAYQNELDILGMRQSQMMSQKLTDTKVKSMKKSNKISQGASILSGVAKLSSSGVI